MTFSKDSALQLLSLNEAAYLLANTGHCVLPDGFTEPVAIRLPAEGRPILLSHDDLDIFGFVTSKNGAAYVVFRGTQILSGLDFAAEWALDALSLPLRVYGTGKVHLGFYDAWMALTEPTLQIVQTSVAGNGTRGLFITGHSLGAAIATLCWADLGGNLMTFASPRVGDPDFAKSLWEGQTVRVINDPDVVPKIPTDPPFRHGGQEITVNGPGSLTDLKLAHALESYRLGIEALL